MRKQIRPWNKKTMFCGFSFVVFYRNVPQGCFRCWLSFAAFPIWIFTFSKFRLEENTVKYAPRKVYIKESSGYVELSYKDFCRRRQTDQSYMDKLFIPVQGCLLEVMREQYTEFYKDKERWRYLKKLDTNHSLLSLEGFTDGEGNVIAVRHNAECCKQTDS